MESHFEWTWHGLSLSTHRKAAGVLSKHPTRIQNGAEAKKLVIWLDHLLPSSGRRLVWSPDLIRRIYRFQYRVRENARNTESDPRWGWFWVWDRD